MSIEPNLWYETFRRILRRSEFAEPLRDAALAGHLRKWTQILTKVIVETCQALGWSAVAKEQASNILPISRQEYLSLDITAFRVPSDRKEPRWQLPIAVFELENRKDNNLVAYSLWKVSAIRAKLKSVFCYRYHTEEIPRLLKALANSVMSEPSIGEDTATILLVVGTQAKADTFPDGFFQPYSWDFQWRKFCNLV